MPFSNDTIQKQGKIFFIQRKTKRRFIEKIQYLADYFGKFSGYTRSLILSFNLIFE